MRHGWTAESMLAAIEEKLGYKFDPSPVSEDVVPDDVYRDHIGVTPQRQPGLSAIGASVLGGRLTGEQLVQLADLAEQFGDGNLRATIMQNILVANVPNARTRDAVHRLGEIGLRVEVSPFWRGAIACTGTEFCKLAIAETKAFSKWLTSEMEERLPAFDQQIKLHVTGCTNSCGQSWIADIGLEARRSSATASWSMPSTSASAGPLANMRASRARSASAPPPRTAPTPSSACCAPTSPRALPAKTSAPTSPAPTMNPFAPSSPAPPSPPSNATLPPLAAATSWKHNGL